MSEGSAAVFIAVVAASFIAQGNIFLQSCKRERERDPHLNADFNSISALSQVTCWNGAQNSDVRCAGKEKCLNSEWKLR